MLSDSHQHGWRIIYLKRTNLLRRAIPDLRAGKTGTFHNVDGQRRGPRCRIKVEPAEVTRLIELRLAYLERERWTRGPAATPYDRIRA